MNGIALPGGIENRLYSGVIKMNGDIHDPKQALSGGLTKYVKPVAALLATGLILYFLFGIPAYILFKEL